MFEPNKEIILQKLQVSFSNISPPCPPSHHSHFPCLATTPPHYNIQIYFPSPMLNSRKSTQNLIDFGLPKPGQTPNLRNSDNSHYTLNNQISMSKSNVFLRTQLPQQLSFKPIQTHIKNSNIFTIGEPTPRLNFKDSTGGVKKYDTPTSAQSTEPEALIFKPKVESVKYEQMNPMSYSSCGKLSGDGSFESLATRNEITVTNPYVTQSSSGTNKLQFKQTPPTIHNNPSSLPSGSPQGEISFRSKPTIHEALKDSVGSNAANIKMVKESQTQVDGDGAVGRLQRYRKKTFKDFSEHFTEKQQSVQSYVMKTNQGKVFLDGNQEKGFRGIQETTFKAAVSISGTAVNSHQNSEKKQMSSGSVSTSNDSFYYYSYPHPNFVNPYHKDSKPDAPPTPPASTHPITNYIQYAPAPTPDPTKLQTPTAHKIQIIQQQTSEKPSRTTPNSQNSNFSKFKNNSSSPGKQHSGFKERTAPRVGVKLSDFRMGKKLGKGKFGDVFIAQDIRTGFICALKIIKKKTLVEEKVDHQFIRELKIQFYLSHPKIVALYGFFDDETNFYMLLEYAIDGHLFGILKEKKRLAEEQTKTIIRQVCQGIEYMHSQRILHRDLKPQNILIQFGIPKICDFGWAIYRADTLRDTFCGTPLYISPQILTGEKYDESADLWAVGILTYELLIGKIPFRIRSEQDLIKIINEQIVFPQHVNISETCKDFVMRMLERDPANRYDIEQVLSHPFLTEKEAPKLSVESG